MILNLKVKRDSNIGELSIINLKLLLISSYSIGAKTFESMSMFMESIYSMVLRDRLEVYSFLSSNIEPQRIQIETMKLLV